MAPWADATHDGCELGAVEHRFGREVEGTADAAPEDSHQRISDVVGMHTLHGQVAWQRSEPEDLGPQECKRHQCPDEVARHLACRKGLEDQRRPYPSDEQIVDLVQHRFASSLVDAVRGGRHPLVDQPSSFHCPGAAA